VIYSKKVKETDRPVWVATSGYLAAVDEALCEGCEICVEHCQLSAISMNDEAIAVVDENRCIGCGGLCQPFVLRKPYP